MRSIRILSFRCRLLLLLAVGLAVAFAPVECGAITLGQVDDFTSGTTMNWTGAEPINVADPLSAEVGDRALQVVAQGGGGFGSRLVTYNTVQWGGNWTAAGVERIVLDLLNPNPSGDLRMRLGLAGPGAPGSFGSGPTYGSVESFVIPADNQWHRVIFDVSPTGWQNIGGTDIAAALASVNQFRILHNELARFDAAIIAASFLVDNITALAAPTGVDGDYNGDGIVDAADYTVWRDSLGQTGPDLAADGNGDAVVDAEDYSYWKERFGNESGSGAATAIPEPASILLGAMLMLMVGLWRWFDLRATTGRH